MRTEVEIPHAVDARDPRARDRRPRVRDSARPRADGRRDDHGLRPRGRGAGRTRQAVPRLPPGRAGERGAAADDAEHALLAAARPEGLPRAVTRPAGHRAFDAGRDAPWADARAAGGVPEAAPRRLDRPR